MPRTPSSTLQKIYGQKLTFKFTSYTKKIRNFSTAQPRYRFEITVHKFWRRAWMGLGVIKRGKWNRKRKMTIFPTSKEKRLEKRFQKASKWQRKKRWLALIDTKIFALLGLCEGRFSSFFLLFGFISQKYDGLKIFCRWFLLISFVLSRCLLFLGKPSASKNALWFFCFCNFSTTSRRFMEELWKKFLKLFPL